MEAIGLTLGLITFSGIVYTTAQSFWDAPEVVKQLVHELTALQKTLEKVRSVVGDTALTAEIETCMATLDTKLRASTKGFRGKVRSGLKRMKWPLDERETREYITQIERLMTSLGVELQAHHMYEPTLTGERRVLIFLELWLGRRRRGSGLNGSGRGWRGRNRRRSEGSGNWNGVRRKVGAVVSLGFHPPLINTKY